MALVGITVGIPLGVVDGRAAWLAFASNLGVVPVGVVPIWLIIILAVGVTVVADVIAIGPALRARRSTLDDLLRVA